MQASEFDYELPDSSIAQTPREPRDAARLLDTTTGLDHDFRDLPDLLDPGDLVVVNETRVRSARLNGQKVEGGGAVELLLLSRSTVGTWRALVRPARRVRAGTRVSVGDVEVEITSDPIHGLVEVRFEIEGGREAEEAVIDAIGDVPLPPYIQNRIEEPDRYQTLFASTTGSAAAPTAGLHFTPAVLDGLADRAIEVARVDLEVGIGTFRPISVEDIADHVMHGERFRIPAETTSAVESARRRRGSVVAIGTTVVRALESATGPGGIVREGEAQTDLFIRPGYEWKVVDRLVTNFHLPRSSLIVMIAAFMGPTWREAYIAALERGYRFLSFGDAMLADRWRGK